VIDSINSDSRRWCFGFGRESEGRCGKQENGGDDSGELGHYCEYDEKTLEEVSKELL